MGRPAESPVRADVAAPCGELPRCPAWLHRHAKGEWRRLVGLPELASRLTEASQGPLACLCQAIAEFRLATELLEKEGRTLQTEKGYTYPHPAVAQQRSAWSAVEKFSALFGLDPVSRAKMGAPAQGKPKVDARKRG